SLSHVAIPPPPTPTLFPYTTLFRSAGDFNHFRGAAKLQRNIQSQYLVELKGNILAEKFLEALLGDFDLVGAHGNLEKNVLARGADRKSTRLNSSHQIISYAVFCLKK